MRLATLLLLALATPLRAQVADTTTASRYFPLGVGDVWHYDMMQEGGMAPTEYRYREVRTVVGETVIGGRTYRVIAIQRSNIPPSMPWPTPTTATFYVRWDEATARPMRSSGSGPNESPFDGGGCRLDEAFPTSAEDPRFVACPPPLDPTGAITGGYGRTVDVGGLSYTATEKRFVYFGAVQTHVTYAAGIGLLNTGFCENWCNEATLRYARVGGVVYGSPFVASEPGAAPAALTLTVTPNPAGGPLTLTLALPVAGAVTVEAFDVTGRRVYLVTPSLAAGAHTLDVDAAAWAPGVYVVRATANGAMVAARVVRQ
ncbi:MAG TPA: T9SS type A sorting domain-containing protein [Rhodothermales bacterium]|nr:T9SS type A sorting domain-containing protein [Rhodothermales bacterium]